MKTACSIIVLLCSTITVSFSQGNFILPGHWTVTNHGVDYPVKNFYTFGEKPSFDDGKVIRDNRSLQFNGEGSKNGLVVVAYSRKLNSDSSSFELYISDSMDRAGIPQVNGEYNFDWMETTTKVNQTVVDQFIYFLNELPDDAIVLMYSGYYHEMDKMDESFYEAISPFASYEMHYIESNSIWGYIGSKCGIDLPVEFSSTRQDSLLSISHSFRVSCELPSSIGDDKAEELTVYPNPFTNSVNVDLPITEDVEISVSSLNGDVLFETSNVQSLQLGEFPKGIYILQLSTKEKVYTQRIIKQ